MNPAKRILEINDLIKKYKKSFWGFRRRRVPVLKREEFKLLTEDLILNDPNFKAKHEENMCDLFNKNPNK